MRSHFGQTGTPPEDAAAELLLFAPFLELEGVVVVGMTFATCNLQVRNQSHSSLHINYLSVAAPTSKVQAIEFLLL